MAQNEMTKLVLYIAAISAITYDPATGSLEKTDNSKETFEFTRVEPGNELGIITKIISHHHRPAKKLTETWRLNREFTPEDVLTKLASACDKVIDSSDKHIKWNNCVLDSDGLTADLTWNGVREPKNKTTQYLEMRYKPFERIRNGKKESCILDIVPENPAYFMLQTYSKNVDNTSLPTTPEQSVDSTHVHQLGEFGPEFLSIYGDSIDQDGIYMFDQEDYYKREEPYECFLSIGSSESVDVIEKKCPFKCEEISATVKQDLRIEL